MRRKLRARESSIGGQPERPRSVGEPYGLLRALFSSSTVGVAIFDREFRYRAINDALACMNGVPADAHLGKTLRAVLGDAATKVQPAFEHVFATGQPLCNVEIVAELPSRSAVGHWNESCFPIKDQAGQVQEVGVMVLELTKSKEIDSALLRLTDKLTRIISAWRADPVALDGLNSDSDFTRLAGVFMRSVTLLESCLSETRAISNLLHAAPHPSAVQSPDAHLVDDAALLPAPGLDFVRAGPAEGVSPLSAREREVTALLANGKSNKQIGSMLTISTRTVESHRARIMLKLDLHSVGELVRYAVRSHLIRP
ncbi:MAG: domain S-box [Candidatus Acidoferrum typicum]|nr:domain S-box [Candidatus Acidoferrum typicum]